MKFLLLAFIVSTSISAVEINLEPGIKYNGGDGKSGYCYIELVNNLDGKTIIRAHPGILTRKFDGSGRVFTVIKKDANTYIGNGSKQEYLNAPGTPSSWVVNPNDILELKLREDGTPKEFLLRNTTFKETTVCKDLMDAPY